MTLLYKNNCFKKLPEMLPLILQNNLTLTSHFKEKNLNELVKFIHHYLNLHEKVC